MATAAIRPQAQSSLVLRHMPSLDSLRGVAVLLVLLFHGYGSFEWKHVYGPFWGELLSSIVGCGRFGVNVFFVLSGFLITGILLRSRERTDFYQNFYIRRVLRIVPVYLLLLLVLRALHTIDWRFALAAVLFLANFSRLFGAPLNEYGALWSLAVEEHFYLLWPTCVRRLTERTLVRILALVLVGEPLLRLLAAHISSHIDIHYKTPFVLDFIGYGALLALLVQNHRIHLGNVARIAGLLAGVGSALALLAIWCAAFHPGATVAALSDLPFTWTACGILLLGLRRDHIRFERTGRTKSTGFLAFYGYISYGLYLFHVELFTLAKDYLFRHVQLQAQYNLYLFSTALVVLIGVATGLAWLSRRYFEGPILHIKNKWQDRFARPTAPPPTPIALSPD